MQNNSYNNKVLLYSGGMDSWLIDKIWKPDVKLYVDMNTKYSQEEIKRLPSDVIIDKLDLSKWEREDKIIPLRNMYLIGIASNYGNEICLGATAGDRVLDKSPVFADIYEQLLSMDIINIGERNRFDVSLKFTQVEYIKNMKNTFDLIFK